MASPLGRPPENSMTRLSIDCDLFHHQWEYGPYRKVQYPSQRSAPYDTTGIKECFSTRPYNDGDAPPLAMPHVLRTEESRSPIDSRATEEPSKLSMHSQETVHARQVPDCRPPPYDRRNDIKATFDETKPFNSGGTGQVFQATIERNAELSFLASKLVYCGTREPDFVAIKKLNSANSHDFSRELTSLRCLTQKRHPHIVPLLGAYQMGSQHHLVFPWADGDLSMYWRLYPEPHIDKSTLEWVAKQTRGLADALSVVHGYEDGKAKRKWYGRHGDIKPANILWFPNNNLSINKDDQRGPKCWDIASKPQLTLADFGSSLIVPVDGQHVPQAENVKHTPVYRAPECDINSGRLTPAYDVWSLGCVFAEMLVWLIDGNIGLQELSMARFDEEENSPNRDAFFQLQRDMGGSLTAQIKPDVQRLLLSLRNHPRSTPFTDDTLNLIMDGMLKIDMDQRMTSRDVYNALKKICEKLADSPDYAAPRCGRDDHSTRCGSVKAFSFQAPSTATRDNSLTVSGSQVHSNQYARKRQRLDRTVNANYYTNATTQSLSEPVSSIDSQPHLKFACPFFKSGILVSTYSRACRGPGFNTVARLKEHILRCHTPDKYKHERVCKRCDEEFETEKLFLSHQHQYPPCLIQAPEIIYGMVDREQAANLRSTKRKSSSYSDEDRWFDIYRTINPSYDPIVDKVSPYHECNTTSLDTLSTQSSNGISQYKDYLQQPLAGNKLQEFAAEMGASLGISNPEVCMAWAAKLRDFQLKDLEKFNEDKLKPAYTYEMPLSVNGEKVEAVEGSKVQVPDTASPLSQFLMSLGSEGERGGL